MKQAKKQTIIRQIISICACLIISGTASAQQDYNILQLLQEEGFEDIRTIMVEDTLFAAIEDRAHRGTFRGAATAIRTIADRHPEVNNFEMLLTDYQMPQLIVHASKRGDIWSVSVDRQMEKAVKVLKGVTPQAASTGKIDVSFVPMVSLVNHAYDHLFDYAIRIAPAIATTVWKGGRITIQPIFPILYNVKEGNRKRYIQIANANLSQQILSNREWTITAAAGFFHTERVGIHATVGYHVMRNLDFYIDGGYTWTANNSEDTGFGIIRNTGQTDFMAKIDYYEPYTKLQIELKGGKFLNDYYGGRVDVTRHFGEYAIGLFGILANSDYEAGFHFAIPFGGKRQKRSAFVRLRLPEYYALEYNKVSMGVGQSYVTQPDQNHAAHYWEPAYVQEYVQRMLNGTFQ